LQKAYHSDGQVGKLCGLTPPKTVISYRIMPDLETRLRDVLREIRSREETAKALAKDPTAQHDAAAYRTMARAYSEAARLLEAGLSDGS
jgi:hypothetical protein